LENDGDTYESTRKPAGDAEQHRKAISKNERLSESDPSEIGLAMRMAICCNNDGKNPQ
jgi:hypothetical protein